VPTAVTTPAEPTGLGGARAPGRPRSEEADRAILEATLAVVAEEGISGLSVEAVAHRAGVGKATIYRRFASKEDLLTGVFATLADDLSVPVDDLPTVEALAAIVEQIWDAMLTRGAWRIMPRVLSAADTHPALYQCYYRTVVAPRHDVVVAVLRRGVERGDVRADVDMDLVAAALLGPAVYLAKMRPEPLVRPAAGTATRLVELLLAGVGVPAPASRTRSSARSGPPPS